MGYGVSMPFGNNGRYDMILDIKGKLFKVQCKTSWYRNGVIVFSTCSTNGFTYKKKSYVGQIDFFAVYSQRWNKYYLIPIKNTPSTNMCLRVRRIRRNGMPKNIRWANQYEI